MSRRILVLSTKFPWPRTGACEQDRSQGILDFLRYGHEVAVLTKYRPSQPAEIARVRADLGIEVRALPFASDVPRTTADRLREAADRLAHPLLLDGAAYEYARPETRAAFLEMLESFRPDLVWAEYSYLWPLARLAKRAGLPVVTRPANFEARHFLTETGGVPFKRLRYAVKWLGEREAARLSDVVCAISPKEADAFRALGARRVELLPLRSLPEKAPCPHVPKDKPVLDAFFAASTYAVRHNALAAEAALRDAIPAIHRAHPGRFRFHFLGARFPETLRPLLGPAAAEAPGYVPDIEEFLGGMDVALAPSVAGEGMQQKVFEPLMRGFPTVTQARPLAGYPFRDGEHLLLAEDPEACARAFGRLLDARERARLSGNARTLAHELFSRERIDAVTRGVLESLL